MYGKQMDESDYIEMDPSACSSIRPVVVATGSLTEFRTESSRSRSIPLGQRCAVPRRAFVRIVVEQSDTAIGPEQRSRCRHIWWHPREESAHDLLAQLSRQLHRQLEPKSGVEAVDKDLDAAHRQPAFDVGHAVGVECPSVRWHRPGEARQDSRRGSTSRSSSLGGWSTEASVTGSSWVADPARWVA
jgi:hypothetical protein